MKTSNTFARQTPSARSAKLNSKPVPNSSSQTPRQTSKIRNFGWLVTGMVEAGSQIETDNLSQDRC